MIIYIYLLYGEWREDGVKHGARIQNSARARRENLNNVFFLQVDLTY